MYQVELTLLQKELLEELLEKDTQIDASYKARLMNTLSSAKHVKPFCPALPEQGGASFIGGDV